LPVGEADSSEQYDLKKSSGSIGQLYPVLLAKDGEILDGLHRIKSNRSWRTVTLTHIDTPEKKLIARLVANFHRRQISRDEKAEWINSLASFYQKQGLKVEGPRGKAQGSNEVAERIVAATGLGRRTVMTYLRQEFKQNNMARKDPEQHECNSRASDVIRNSLSSRERDNPGYTSRLLDRFKEEVKDELLRSPLFRKQVLDMLPKCWDPEREQTSRANFPDQPGEDIPVKRFRNYRKKKTHNDSDENWIVLEPGWLYDDHLERFPDCSCESCKHKDGCDTRIRPDD
jgi:hypothetical protein